MRWYSNLRSADKLEVSALSVIETIISILFSLYFAVYIIDSWKYIAIASCIAPFLLLRTKASTDVGLNYFSKAVGWFDSSGVWRILIPVPFFLLVPPTINILATIKTLFIMPTASLSAISGNYFKICMCVDSMHTPELVPGIETAEQSDVIKKNAATFKDLIWQMKKITQDDRRVDLIFAIIGASLIYMPAYIVAFAYRYSVKSTAIVWLPLLWIAPKLTPKYNYLTRLKLINRSSWGKVVFIVSIIVLLLFLIKLSIYYGLVSLHIDFVEYSFLNVFVAPAIIPWWQVSSVINSLIAVILYLWASSQLIIFEENILDKETSLQDYALRNAFVVRSILSLYTSVCLLYIVFTQIAVLGFPPLGDRLFPWQ